MAKRWNTFPVIVLIPWGSTRYCILKIALPTIASCRKLRAEKTPQPPTESSLKNCSPCLSLLLYHRKFRENPESRTPGELQHIAQIHQSPLARRGLRKRWGREGPGPLGLEVVVGNPWTKCYVVGPRIHMNPSIIYGKMVEILFSRCTSGSLGDRKCLGKKNSGTTGRSL